MPNLNRFDPASLAILDRINYAIQLLEARSVTPDVPIPTTQRPDDTSIRVENIEASIAQSDATWTGTPSVAASTGIDQDDTNTAALVDVLNVTAKCACTYLLDWPVLRGHVASSSEQPRGIGPTSYGPRDAGLSGHISLSTNPDYKYPSGNGRRS